MDVHELEYEIMHIAGKKSGIISVLSSVLLKINTLNV